MNATSTGKAKKVKLCVLEPLCKSRVFAFEGKSWAFYHWDVLKGAKNSPSWIPAALSLSGDLAKVSTLNRDCEARPRARYDKRNGSRLKLLSLPLSVSASFLPSSRESITWNEHSTDKGENKISSTFAFLYFQFTVSHRQCFSRFRIIKCENYNLIANSH